MTKAEVERMGSFILQSDPTAMQSMISLKQQMQQEFINQLSASESMEIALNTRNQSTINKLYSVGNKSLQRTNKSDKDIYITGLVVATILKELFEDVSFVSNENLTNVISRIQ